MTQTQTILHRITQLGTKHATFTNKDIAKLHPNIPYSSLTATTARLLTTGDLIKHSTKDRISNYALSEPWRKGGMAYLKNAAGRFNKVRDNYRRIGVTVASAEPNGRIGQVNMLSAVKISRFMEERERGCTTPVIVANARLTQPIVRTAMARLLAAGLVRYEPEHQTWLKTNHWDHAKAVHTMQHSTGEQDVKTVTKEKLATVQPKAARHASDDELLEGFVTMIRTWQRDSARLHEIMEAINGGGNHDQ